MLNQKQYKDGLTKLELRVYGILCYSALTLFFIVGYFIVASQSMETQAIALILSFIFLAISAVFGFAIQHDTRVLDLREKD